MATKPGEVRTFVHNLIDTCYGPGPCILWPYGVRQGYGAIHVARPHGDKSRNQMVSVIRYIMIAIDGPDRPGWTVAHLPVVCHEIACVRPAHLRWATPMENARDRLLDGTAGKAAVSPEIIAEIRSRHAAGGVSYAQLAAEYGVTQSTIGRFIRGQIRASRIAS